MGIDTTHLALFDSKKITTSKEKKYLQLIKAVFAQLLDPPGPGKTPTGWTRAE